MQAAKSQQAAQLQHKQDGSPLTQTDLLAQTQVINCLLDEGAYGYSSPQGKPLDSIYFNNTGADITA